MSIKIWREAKEATSNDILRALLHIIADMHVAKHL